MQISSVDLTDPQGFQIDPVFVIFHLNIGQNVRFLFLLAYISNFFLS